MGQVFLNIMMNALDAMPRGGGLTVSTSADEKTVAVRFRDTGCGIDANDLIRIFDPFYTTKKVGSGLGLAICYSIVASHEGTITVKSQKGKGSAFTVELPLKKPKPVGSLDFLGVER
jgi:signal transduction histidine kinase